METLDRYAAAVGELVLHLRDEGHILSPIDQHMIERWWDSGYPLETVLRTVRETGDKLKKRKKPPRGLPLKSMRRQVDKAGQRAVDASVGAHTTAPEVEPVAAAETLGVVASFRADIAAADPTPALHAADAALAALGDVGPEEAFADLIAISRRYYDACLEALGDDERARMRARVREELGEGAAAMDLDALEETVLELCRRRLRTSDPILHPDRVWSL
ncbi:MAG: hypothetical protein GY898_33035 [Proteobacteria bacterium]|nr:hypothetical protein [Pseudomonadota bacterium]